MEILGYEVDGLLFAQFVVTAFVIGAFAVRTSLQEARSERASLAQMVLLADFLTRHHPRYPSIPQIAGVEALEPGDGSSELYWLAHHAGSYRRTGELPAPEAFRGSSLAQHLLYLLLAPLTGIVFPIGHALVSGKPGLERIAHTAAREDVLSKFLYVLAANLFYLAALLVLVFPSELTLARSALILGSIAAVATLLGMLGVVRAQVAWKEFWDDALLEVAARAGQRDDHDLFNRALILRTQVEAQPDLPLPGGFGFYAGAYTFVQAALLALSKLTGWPGA